MFAIKRVEFTAGDILLGSAEPSMGDTLETMRLVLSKRFGIDNPDLAENSALSALGLDSLSFVEYAFELESELGIIFPDLPRDLVSVGDLARYVHSQVLQQPAGRGPR